MAKKTNSLRNYLKTISVSSLKRAYIFKFFSRFRELVREVGAETLDFMPKWEKFDKLYHELDEIMRPIRISSLTPELKALDEKRDKLFSGLRETVKGSLNNFEPAKVEAAKTLMEVFKTYKNVTGEGQEAETGDMYNAITDLRTTYLPQVTTLGLAAWITELDKANKAFSNMWLERDQKLNVGKPDFKFEDVAPEMDYYYNLFMWKLEYLMDDGNVSETIKTFVETWNGVIQYYKNILAQEEGRREGDDEEED